MMCSLMALDGKEEMSGSGLSSVLIFMHCLLLCCNQVEQIPCLGMEMRVDMSSVCSVAVDVWSASESSSA